MRPWPGRGVRGPGMLARAVVARAASCAGCAAIRARTYSWPWSAAFWVLLWEVLLAAMIKFTPHVNLPLLHESVVTVNW